MPFESRSSTDLTTYTLRIDGSELSAKFQVEYIDIRRAVNRIASAEIAFIDGNPAEQDFSLSSAAELVPGAEIQIELGYSNQNQSVFAGVIISQQVKVTRPGHSRLIVSCKDRAFVLAQGSQSAHYSEQTDADVLSQIVTEAGLSADIAPTSVTHTDIVQMRESHWDFIITRAEKNGLLVLTNDGTVSAQPPAAPLSQGSISYGRNVIDADLSIDARCQYGATGSTGWSLSEQANSHADGSSGISTPGNLTSEQLAQASGDVTQTLRADGYQDPGSLQQWANASVDRQRLAHVQGVVTIQGQVSAAPGQWLTLEGFGDRFTGNVFVGGVMHAVSRGNWLTSVQLGMPQDWHYETFNPAKNKQSAQVGGLYIGKVTALESDPSGEERIQIKLMTLGDDHQGIWARQAASYAGSERGAVFRPELDDEVIVGFVDGDAAQPVVLGALYSSANIAPLSASDDNHEKGWTTRSGMQVVFNDEDVSLTLLTPAGNQIVLSEDEGSISILDENDNQWVMNSDGISVNAAGKISIENSADIEIKGTNVSLEASANLTLKAGANADLEGGGITTVKGSLVQIN